MLNELEELAPTNAATFNGVTLIALARELASMLKQRRANHGESYNTIPRV